MNSNSPIANDIDRIRRELNTYRTQVYTKVGAVGLRYIDDNFRAQGYQSRTLIPWKATKKKQNTFGLGKKVSVNAAGKTVRKSMSKGILIRTGRLRRSFRTNSPGPGLVRWFTDVPYAKAHNLGFKGTVGVKAHTRRIMFKTKLFDITTRKGRTVKADKGSLVIGAHTRQMNIPRRQFMPSTDRPSEIFSKRIWGKINSDVQRILKHRS